ncbi:MAG: hypothetical protein WBK91_10525 [Alphaproteobacteria bacterium]
MQIPTQNNAIPTPLPAISPQVIRAVVQPPATPTITPRAIDPNEHGNKGTATGSATQRQNTGTGGTIASSRRNQRGGNLDVSV